MTNLNAIRGRSRLTGLIDPRAESPVPYAGGVFWFDATTLALNDNDLVATWTNMFNAGTYDAAQGTEGNRPAFKTAIQNGLPVVRNASTKTMTVSSVSGEFSGNNGTLYVVFRLTGTQEQYGVMDINNVGDEFWRYIDSTSYPAMFRGARINSAFVAPNSGNAIWTIVSDASGNTYKIWVNAVNKVSTTPSFGVATDVTLFSSASAGALVGDICEVLVYNVAHDATLNTVMWNYLNGKWAIY